MQFQITVITAGRNNMKNIITNFTRKPMVKECFTKNNTLVIVTGL